MLLATEVSVCLADCKSLVTASGPNLPASHRNSGEGYAYGDSQQTDSGKKNMLSKQGFLY